MSEVILSAPQKWREVLARFDASGSSAAAFCRENDIAESSFFSWRRRLSLPHAAAGPAFVEAKATAGPVAAPPTGVIEIRLRAGRRVRVRRGFDRVLLAEVVATLEGLPATSERAS
jgi:hypothetical protein